MASLGCALAPNLAVLLLMRVVQAGGAAMLQANSVALMRTTVGPQQLGRAIGAQGAAQAIGPGARTRGRWSAHPSWRVALGVLRQCARRDTGHRAGVVAVAPVPASRAAGPVRLGGVADVCRRAPCCCCSRCPCSLTPARPRRWGCSWRRRCASPSRFVRVERRAKAPLVDLRVFGDGRVTAAIASGLLGYLVLFGASASQPVVPGIGLPRIARRRWPDHHSAAIRAGPSRAARWHCR